MEISPSYGGMLDIDDDDDDTYVHSYMGIPIFIYVMLHIHKLDIYINIMHILQSHIHTH